MKPSVKYISIGKEIVATFYYHPSFTNSMLRMGGAPSTWETKSQTHQSLAEKYKINILVPDYIGFGRSNGKFSLRNCVETLLICFDFLKGRINSMDLMDGTQIKVESKEVLVIGSSFGGGVVPFINKYSKKNDIKYIGLLYPVTDWRTLGKNEFGEEENMEEFNKQMLNLYSNVYRGYKGSEFEGLTMKKENILKEYNPIDNALLMKGFTVFIAHGDKDKSINWERSKTYYEKLKETGIDVTFKLFRNSQHSSEPIKHKGLGWMIDEMKKRAR